MYKSIKLNSDILQEIIDATPSAILMVDSEGMIVLASDRTCELFGYSPKEFKGMCVEDLLPESLRKTHIIDRQNYFHNPSKREMGQGRDLFGQHKDGHKIPIEIGLNPFTLNGKTFVMATIIDISERIRSQKLDSERDAAIKSSQMKSQFLANMSHEIRTPMNGIMGLVELLSDSDLSAEQRSYVDNIVLSSNNLLSIISNILDLSKIESGKVEFEDNNFYLNNFIQKICAQFSGQAENKSLSFKMSLPPTNILVSGDPVRLGQVLSNLVSNAIKFTDSGVITLELDVSKKMDLFDCTFRVIDSGCGISVEDTEKLFKEFSQVDDSSTRKYGGTGLGLAICKKLVELMRGTIKVESQPNKGSVFIVNIPFFPGDPEDVAPEYSSSSVKKINLKDKGDTLGDLSILLVEDNDVNQLVMSELFKKMGLKASLADNGVEALKILENQKFDLILMDCQMPVMDGYEATREIRSSKKDYRNIPIIALTANAIKGDRDKCIAAGMNDYLPKPIKTDEFIKVLAKYVSKDVKVAATPQEALDFVEATKIISEDMGEEFLQMLLIRFEKNYQLTIEKIHKFYKAKDCENIAQSAHFLISNCRYIGQDEMSDLLRSIEQEAKAEKLDNVERYVSRIEEIFKAIGPQIASYKED